ncbi:MAG: hypothetical protein JXB62_14650 [Pirellulales bacterium]|nr:hypothetical protein [Pirellulales bacterium]
MVSDDLDISARLTSRVDLLAEPSDWDEALADYLLRYVRGNAPGGAPTVDRAGPDGSQERHQI